MDTPFIAFAVIALIGLGVLAFAGFDSSITGYGTRITIPQQTLQKVIPVAEEDNMPESPVQSGCACLDFSNRVVSKGDSYGNFDTGLSIHDCAIMEQIVLLRNELKLDTSGFDIYKNLCQKRGWW